MVKCPLIVHCATRDDWHLVESMTKLGAMKVEESVTNYFTYVKNVLGVTSVQSTKMREGLSATSSPQVCDILFLHFKTPEDQSVFVPDSKELLDKMIQAMRLENKTFQILEHDAQKEGVLFGNSLVQHVNQNVSASFVVIFTAKPSRNGVIQNLGMQKFLETLSPSYLLQNANAKKMVWLDLQKVMKELGVL